MYMCRLGINKPGCKASTVGIEVFQVVMLNHRVGDSQWSEGTYSLRL